MSRLYAYSSAVESMRIVFTILHRRTYLDIPFARQLGHELQGTDVS